MYILIYSGFGFLDNLIMIMAGEYIDLTLGATLGISTMAAAALGKRRSTYIFSQKIMLFFFLPFSQLIFYLPSTVKNGGKYTYLFPLFILFPPFLPLVPLFPFPSPLSPFSFFLFPFTTSPAPQKRF